MVKKVSGLLVLVLITFIFFFPLKIFAADEFAATYGVTYEVNESGVTTVNEDIALKNLTERFYASSFTLTIGATQISDVLASDNQGLLDTKVTQQGNRTEIKVKFSQQVVGKDKVYQWRLKFSSKDFAEKQGKVWQVSIPKISSTSNVEDYNLKLIIPLKFGDPTSILPEPFSESESLGKVNYFFKKNQLLKNGILALFGENQLYSFNLKYTLTNDNLITAFAKVPLPPQTSYQEVQIISINPKPENVIFDLDGNQIAYYNINPKTSEKIEIGGLVKIYASPKYKETLNSKQINTFLNAQKYWEVNNPVIKAKLKEIVPDKSLSTKEKASLINQYIVNNLDYSQQRLEGGDFERLGALTTLNNPSNALCSEFSDLFITLSRGLDIPARELVGYAYSANKDLRPLSFGKSILHAWPEYYNSDGNWVMVDPTWQNTTGGVDYFNKFDLNHFVLAIRGLSSEDPSPADEVKVEFSDLEFNPKPKLNIKLEGVQDFYAGFPAKLKVVVENNGSSIFPSSTLILSASKIEITGENSISIPSLPPSGNFEVEINLRTGSPWRSYEDILQVSIGDEKLNQKLQVKPFFALKLFPYAIVATILLMGLIYILTLNIHLREQKNLNASDKKKNS